MTILSMTEPRILLLALRVEEQRGQYALHLSTSVASGYVAHFPGRARGGGYADRSADRLG